MKLDLTKPIRTRDGRPVRILTADGAHTSNGVLQPIIAVVGNDFVGFWSPNGTYDEGKKPETSPLDLFNVPPKMVKTAVTVRLYRDSFAGLYAALLLEGQSSPWGDDFLAEKVIEMEYGEQP